VGDALPLREVPAGGIICNRNLYRREGRTIRWLGGEPVAYESSPGVKRTFCGICGSPMAYTGERWPGEVHLFHGTLEDPTLWPPTGHSYVSEQLPWFEVSDHLPRYEIVRKKGVEPIRTGPRN
jgi:hypothetical protein